MSNISKTQILKLNVQKDRLFYWSLCIVHCDLLYTVCDSSLCCIIRRHLYLHAIARHDTNKIYAHLTRKVTQYDTSIK